MGKKAIVITFFTLFLGLAFIVQPAIATECARLIESIPGHSKGHHPFSKDGPQCDCAQTSQLLLRYTCMLQNRNQFAPDINLSFNIEDVMASQLGIGWLYPNCRCTANLNFVVTEHLPHPPIFLLHQRFLC